MKKTKEDFNTYYTTIDDILKKDNISKKKHPIRYSLREFWYEIRYRIPRKIGDTPARIKRFFQRGYRGYADSDVWGFFDYLSNIISGGLTNLKKNNIGHPCGITSKQWHKILDRIIWTFTVAKEISESNTYYLPSSEWSIPLYKKYTRLCKDFNKKYPETKHRVLTLKETKKFEAGFDLFKEHFFSLWD